MDILNFHVEKFGNTFLYGLYIFVLRRLLSPEVIKYFCILSYKNVPVHFEVIILAGMDFLVSTLVRFTSILL